MITKLLGRLVGGVPWWMRVAALLALAGAIYGLGRLHQAEADEVERTRQDRDRLQATVQLLGRRAEITRRIESDAQGEQVQIQTRTRTILKEVAHVVERPVYRDCSLDADGVRLIAAADRGDLSQPAGEPHR